MRYVLPLTKQLPRPRIQASIRSANNVLLSQRQLLTLAIETSCDDTCVAILEDDCSAKQDSNTSNNSAREVSVTPARRPLAQLHFNEKVTAKNTGRGGIHPVEALESHRFHLAKLIDKALLSLPLRENNQQDGRGRIVCRDGNVRRKPDFVTVTRGPGMRANLSSGLETAKGLAVAWQVPLVGVHHMQAHALTPRLIHALSQGRSTDKHSPDFPFLTLLVSGGHTILLYSTGLVEHKILASTTDVAIGDALDKSGRAILPEKIKATTPDTAYGKYLSSYAFPDPSTFALWKVPLRRNDEVNKPVNKFGWQMKTPLSETKDMKFSFAGFASRAEAILREREAILQGPISDEERLMLARTVLGTAFEHLGTRTLMALENLRTHDIDIRSLVVSGGVAANDFLRHYLRVLLDTRAFEHVNLIFPPVKYCTDNAAMIAWTGLEMYKFGYKSDLGIDPLRKWSMDAEAEDGGITGVWGYQRVNASA